MIRHAWRARQRGAGPWLALAFGITLAVLAIAFNPWTVARLFSPDGRLEHPLILAVILCAELLLLGTGAWLIVRAPKFTTGQAVATMAAWALMLLGVEGLVRIAYLQDDLWYPAMQRSETFGWAPRADFQSERELPNYGFVSYATGAGGFRRRGDPASDRPRVLVLGDSFTEALQVSNGATYYDYLSDSTELEIEVYAFGASGYGSLQEYLVLDAVIDEIRPDLVLWQFCANDLINNLRALEARSLVNNSWWRRPYLEEGEVRLRTPSMGWLSQYSRLAQLVESRRAQARAERVVLGLPTSPSIEALLTPEHPLLVESIETTIEIMRLARARADSVPVVAFAVDRPEWAPTAFERIAKAAGIRFIAGVPERVAAAKRAGLRVDGGSNLHWNALGHAIAGRVLADSLLAWGLPCRRGDGRCGEGGGRARHLLSDRDASASPRGAASELLPVPE